MKRKKTINISQNELMHIIQADGTLTPSQFQKFIITYLLGDNYYIVGPCGGDQGRMFILIDILKKYSKRFNAELDVLINKNNA